MSELPQEPASNPEQPPAAPPPVAEDPRARRRAARRGRPAAGGTRVLLGITLFGLTLFVGSAAAVAWVALKGDAGDVKDESFLAVNLSGSLRDSPGKGNPFQDPEDQAPVVTEVAEAIRAAATDERIDGMYLNIDNPQAGWASYQEIRTAIDEFRAAGKPCVAYAEMFGNGSYYVASGCDKVVMAPSGISIMFGLSTSVTYYAGTFEKLGVEAELLHVGDFKSAVEPFERSEPSPAAAQAYEYLLDGLYGQMVDGIASGRGLEPAEVRSIIDDPPMSANQMLDRGLVDALAFRDAVVHTAHDVNDEGWVEGLDGDIKELEKEELKQKFTSIKEYLKGVRYKHSRKTEKIAIVHAEGQIVSGDSEGGLFGGDSVLADKPFRRMMRAARKDEAIKAVVLRVDSPGGSGLASDMMWREIKLTQKAGKPVVVSMGDLAASGGYYISAPADWIVAQPGTITGSIGVFGGKFNLSGTYDKVGMTQHTFKRGELSNLFSPTQPFSEDGRRVYQSFLDNFYQVFLGRVAEGRELDVADVHVVAQGRVWTGTQALDRKLVDELGGVEVAVAKAAELASVEDYGITRLPKRKTFVELLLEDLNKEAKVSVDLSDLGLGVDAGSVTDVMVLASILSDGGVAALLPGNLTVE